jgi:N6-adenosine-specific RNA methylase IME4
LLSEVEGAVQWWIGDWWAFGVDRQYGDGESIAEAVGLNYATVRSYASVARAYELSSRLDNLSFSHHQEAANAPTEERRLWLDRAEAEAWSCNQLRNQISRQKNLIGASPDSGTCRVEDLDTLMATGTKFSTIYADPPWLYGNQGTRAATGNHYSGMSVAEIAALPVAELAAPNAHLHLWTTNGFLFDAPRIMDAWGFSYKSCFVWVKPDFGMGNYWRVAHEFLLFGIRGSAPFQDRGLISWGEYGRGPHSTKPAEIRDLIERASPAPRLELFARRVAPGWTVWGDNIERDLFYAAD